MRRLRIDRSAGSGFAGRVGMVPRGSRVLRSSASIRSGTADHCADASVVARRRAAGFHGDGDCAAAHGDGDAAGFHGDGDGAEHGRTYGIRGEPDKVRVERGVKEGSGTDGQFPGGCGFPRFLPVPGRSGFPGSFRDSSLLLPPLRPIVELEGAGPRGSLRLDFPVGFPGAVPHPA